MYRYSVDNAVTYTPDDFVLFRESPFAVWMERLTLENPEHGILPDVHTIAPRESAECQEHIVDTLRAEGRDVVLIGWGLEESERRSSTLAAMRDGADFIVDGQLALGPLSGAANLLMRTSGYSELGNFLYVPCDTQVKTTLHSAFRLCFLTDLLHSLQGQLPPQMLVIRGDSDVVPLQTEDHIFYYRAVKQRFMDDMRTFRKHRMPDPADSSHFGRWAECASEVLKQRALSEEQRMGQEQAQEAPLPESAELPIASVAGEPPQSHESDTLGSQSSGQAITPAPVLVSTATEAGRSGQTLAEQARMLSPDSFSIAAAPGPTPSLARSVRARPATLEESPADGVVQADEPEEQAGETGVNATRERKTPDIALENLEFIGSSPRASFVPPEQVVVSSANISLADIPAAALSDHLPVPGDEPEQREHENICAAALPDLEPPAPYLLPPDEPLADVQPRKAHPLDSEVFAAVSASVVDLDSAPPPTLAPVAVADEPEPEAAEGDLRSHRVFTPRERKTDIRHAPARHFSSSLITSSELDDQ